MFVYANYVEDFKLVYIQNKTIMEWRTINGMKAVGYFKDEDKFIKRGEYKETELDKRKREVDFLILGVGNRWEIRFNHPVSLKENRSIKKGECSDNVYFVTSNALEKLKKQYSYECDF